MAAFNALKQAFARERLTVTNAVKTLTAATYNDSANDSNKKKASGAIITMLSGSGDIAFTEEGTAPTADITTVAGVGRPLSAGDVLTLENYNAIAKWKGIRITADAIIEVVYYR